jgi:hypothetical protein
MHKILKEGQYAIQNALSAAPVVFYLGVLIPTRLCCYPAFTLSPTPHRSSLAWSIFTPVYMYIQKPCDRW